MAAHRIKPGRCLFSIMKSTKKVDKLVDAKGVVAAAQECNVAGVLFTYYCTIQCRHCLFGCATNRPKVVMESQKLVEVLRLLRETGRVVHIAGGEPMFFWKQLRAGLRRASDAGVPPHFIETNCSFASDDEVTRNRFELMADCGVSGVLASCDAYHQEFVPAERFLRVRRLAREIFGASHFWGTDAPEEKIRALSGIAKNDNEMGEYVRDNPPIMVGTAREKLAEYLPDYKPDNPELPPGGWRHERHLDSCRLQFDASNMWELHVDPYGNIQTNCGIILGRLENTTPARVMANGPENANRFVAAVCEGGPLNLAEIAHDEHGFKLPEQVHRGCELCFLTRKFLRQYYPETFGPAEIYA